METLSCFLVGGLTGLGTVKRLLSPSCMSVQLVTPLLFLNLATKTNFIGDGIETSEKGDPGFQSSNQLCTRQEYQKREARNIWKQKICGHILVYVCLV